MKHAERTMRIGGLDCIVTGELPARTMVVVLHDMDLVRHHFPLTLLLPGDGSSIWGPTASIAPRLAA